MPNPISKIFAIILAALVMFYLPTYQNYKKQEDLTYVNTYKTVTEFVDNVRMKGFITPSMYEDFVQSLHTGTDVLFDIEIVHSQKVYTPIYTNPSDMTTFTGEYQVDYQEYYWDQIKEPLFGESSVPYEDRIYKLQSGDYFDVYVENKTKFKSRMLLDFLTFNAGNHNDIVISFPYGGMVLNQDWTDN